MLILTTTPPLSLQSGRHGLLNVHRGFYYFDGVRKCVRGCCVVAGESEWSVWFSVLLLFGLLLQTIQLDNKKTIYLCIILYNARFYLVILLLSPLPSVVFFLALSVNVLI